MSDQLIHVLSSAVIDRIAAGEVIERPASVVKELVENSMDAGARAVDVQVEGGGLDRIVVADDGRGMSAADGRLCLERHATSKLAAAEDLFAIRTLGFRGEALSSIAAVSRLTLTTRRPEDATGTRLEVEAGEVRQLAEVGCAAGTVIEVRDLFFNTPARRRFMRSAATEQAHVVDAALRVVLGTRQGGVVVRAGDRRLVDLSEQATPEQRALGAIGRRVERVFAIDGELEGVRVSGVVAPPGVDRADSRGLWFFVNGRYVRDRMLQRAVVEGFRSLVERGRHPIAVVYVDVHPSAVDVNVHPQKLEVRFSDGASVFRAVSRAVASVLAGSPWVQEHRQARVQQAISRFMEGAGYAVGERGGTYGGSGPPPGRRTGAGAGAEEGATTTSRPATTSGAAVDQPQGVAPAGWFSSLRPLGQALGLYLVCEGQGELVLIDQHAAHERVTFQRLREAAESGGIARQPLLFPDIMEAPPRLESLLEERAQSLLAYGFEVEPVGPGRFAVRAIPAALSGAGAAALVRDLIDELEEIEERGGGGAAEDARDRVLSRCACHAAVRAGDRLHPEEIRALLSELDRVDFGAACPHGRPVYHRISRAELDRSFHRG